MRTITQFGKRVFAAVRLIIAIAVVITLGLICFRCTKMHNESKGQLAQALSLILYHAALHLGIDLGGLDTLMPKHFTHHLDRHPMLQGDGSGKGMTSGMCGTHTSQQCLHSFS